MFFICSKFQLGTLGLITSYSQEEELISFVQLNRKTQEKLIPIDGFSKVFVAT